MNSALTIFLERLQLLLPADAWQQVQQSWQHAPATIFRCLGLSEEQRETAECLRADGLSFRSLEWCPELQCLASGQRDALTQHPCFSEGRVYIQNPSSYMAALALAPVPGEEVLDMCAAPGGKTLAIADLMQHQGRLAAVESVRGRFFKLKALTGRHSSGMIHCYHQDARQLWRKTPARFDRIMLDAPCSSEARIRPDNPASYAKWSPKKSGEMQRRQRALIRSAFDCLKPGGSMVYCTCTYSPEENELVVQSLLDRHDHARILPLALPCPQQMPGFVNWRGKELHPDLRLAVRILPTMHQAAFFLCLIGKSA